MEYGNLEFKEKVEKDRIKLRKIYNNLKSDYFLRKVFSNLIQKKILNIVKYNNKIKNRISINIKNYKDYSEKYSSIEIEIKPAKNKNDNFINIKKEDEIYFHIYILIMIKKK